MIKLYSAEWCNPCKQLKQLLKEKGIEYTPVDIDKDPELARVNAVRGVPTLVREDTGQRLVGAVTPEQLRVFLVR